ncbi:hypothetical protein EVAR_87057_1 [Eumeta japonica]|uniref:Uncharacterized protein n=1 Tax=Eumeta variegata TaxID=151549 RepID=A0A4C1VNU4_EUMVA|nr:hypothetical protein EVAR_87057_1 [Eumeta japonica]
MARHRVDEGADGGVRGALSRRRRRRHWADAKTRRAAGGKRPTNFPNDFSAAHAREGSPRVCAGARVLTLPNIVSVEGHQRLRSPLFILF